MQLLKEMISQVIREQHASKQVVIRSVTLLRDAVRLADQYVLSIIAHKRDKVTANKLKQAVQDVLPAAQTLVRYNTNFSQEYVLATKLLKAIAERSGFWKTPKLIGVDEHTKELQDLLKKLKQSARRILIQAKQDLR